MKTEKKLKIIYVIATVQCLIMMLATFFTFFVNASNIGESQDIGFLPHKMHAKYEGQTLVYLTHITPAIFWSMCVPLQFHPRLRKNYPKFHKYLGRAFIYTSYILMIGVVVIIRKNLAFIHYLNGDYEANSDDKVSHLTFLFLVSSCFLYTAIVAVGYARKGDYFNHKIWIMR